MSFAPIAAAIFVSMAIIASAAFVLERRLSPTTEAPRLCGPLIVMVVASVLAFLICVLPVIDRLHMVLAIALSRAGVAYNAAEFWTMLRWVLGFNPLLTILGGATVLAFFYSRLPFLGTQPAPTAWTGTLASWPPTFLPRSMLRQSTSGLRGVPFANSIDRYWGYLLLAHKEQGDYNVIVNEGCAYLLMALPKERTICVCHDMHALLYSGMKDLHHRLFDLRYRSNLRFLPKAKFVVTVSRNTRAELLKHWPFIPEEKVVPVHSGLEEHWRPISVKERLDRFCSQHGLIDKRVVLHVGDDVFYKNIASVVRGFAQLSQSDLVLVQVGSLTRETQNLIDTLGIRQRLRHLANLTDSDLVALYNVAKVLVFPSISEGFGWPPLEAMACGCPVISSGCASLPEVCGDACLYINATEVTQIADAIKKILADKTCGIHSAREGNYRQQSFPGRTRLLAFWCYCNKAVEKVVKPRS